MFRLFIIVVVAFSVLWIPIVKSGSDLFVYTQRVTAFIAPPVCALYLLAVLWPRCTEIGAFVMLVVGLVVGLSRFVCLFDNTVITSILITHILVSVSLAEI